MKNLLFTLSLFALALNMNGQSVNFKDIKAFPPESRIFNIKDFGALGDSISMDTKAIQAAIDACNEKGGGTVWVPAGKSHGRNQVATCRWRLNLKRHGCLFRTFLMKL